jgi:hypothetical protein
LRLSGKKGFLVGQDVSPQRMKGWLADDHKLEVILAARSAFLAAPPKPAESPQEGRSIELRWTDDFKQDDWWSKLRPQLTDYLRAELQRRLKSLAESSLIGVWFGVAKLNRASCYKSNR